MTEEVIPQPADDVKQEMPFAEAIDDEELESMLNSEPPTTEDETPKAAPKKVPFKAIHAQTVETMCGEYVGWPAFHKKFYKLQDRSGVNRYLMEEDKRVRGIETTFIDQEIMKYWRRELPKEGIDLPVMTADDAAKTRRLWELQSDPLPEDPRSIAWKDQEGLAYERMDFNPALPKDFDPDTHIPYFAELLSRLEDWEAITTWIGSLFDPRSYSQQYVWIYGKGGSGKSSFAQVLEKVFKSSGHSEETPEKGNRFWTSGLMDKRLVVFPDTNNTTFITSGLFKSLTGGDSTRIERKGQAAFTAHLRCKFLFHSNSKPRIGHNSADMRRIIYSPIRPIERPLPHYERTLAEEMPLFISFCWKTYQDHAMDNPGKPIPTKVELAEDAAENTDEYFEAVFNQHFNLCDDPEIYVKTEEVTEKLNYSKMIGKYQDQLFKDWLANQPGVVRKRRNKGKKRFTCYLGMCLKGQGGALKSFT